MIQNKMSSILEIVTAENKDFIYISVVSNSKESLSWEQLQDIKDKDFSDLDFIEVYPKKSEVINKANVRHLVHLKNWKCPKLGDFETECLIIESKMNLIENQKND